MYASQSWSEFVSNKLADRILMLNFDGSFDMNYEYELSCIETPGTT
jgi:hypothetical protein